MYLSICFSALDNERLIHASVLIEYPIYLHCTWLDFEQSCKARCDKLNIAFFDIDYVKIVI